MQKTPSYDEAAPRSSLSSVQVPPAKHPSQADSKHHSAHGNSQSGLAQFPDKPLVLLAWVFQYPNTPQNVLLPSNHLLEIMLHIGLPSEANSSVAEEHCQSSRLAALIADL